ncbi:MAG: 50S ribosomal protein L11 methyltransferase, partial [Euzebya sp.]
RQRRSLVGCEVIAIGTGTWILALSARALGAGRVRALDNDPQAIDVARHNLDVHGWDGIDLIVGSCAQAGAPAQVVVANIITDILLGMTQDLAALVAPGGTLITSGVAVERTQEAVDAFTAVGLIPHAHPGREWCLLVCHRPDV